MHYWLSNARAPCVGGAPNYMPSDEHCSGFSHEIACGSRSFANQFQNLVVRLVVDDIPPPGAIRLHWHSLERMQRAVEPGPIGGRQNRIVGPARGLLDRVVVDAEIAGAVHA